MITYKDFLSSVNSGKKPTIDNQYLKALWEEKTGNWDEAHNIVQNIPDEAGAKIHAYLHRKEGDNSNAKFWYMRAGEPFSESPLEEEWEELVKEFIKKESEKEK